MAFSSVLGANKWRDQVGLVSTMDQLDAPQGKVLLYSDSSTMWGGFDQHWDGFRTQVPPGFTTLRAFPGQTHSMLISGGERPYVAGKDQTDGGTQIVSRMTFQPGRWKRAHLATTFSIMGTSDPAVSPAEYDAVYSWSAVVLGFDIQAWDNSDRAFFIAQLFDPLTDDSALPRWKIKHNGGGYRTISNSTESITGENENKGGFNFVRLSIDLENIQPGSTHGEDDDPDTIGRYLELQSNDSVYDLTTVADSGQGWEGPQMPSNEFTDIADYRGGFNPGIGAYRSTRNPNRTPLVCFGPTYVIVEE